MLKQTFTTTKGNKIEIIATKSTGKGIDQVQHTIKVNGVIQETKYNSTQLKQIMV